MDDAIAGGTGRAGAGMVPALSGRLCPDADAPPSRRAVRLMAALRESLTIDAVAKRYGDVVAVDRVSLSVQRGEFVTLLGPSGSGKTTLLMMIAGFVEPDAGAILLDGA